MPTNFRLMEPYLDDRTGKACVNLEHNGYLLRVFQDGSREPVRHPQTGEYVPAPGALNVPRSAGSMPGQQPSSSGDPSSPTREQAYNATPYLARASIPASQYAGMNQQSSSSAQTSGRDMSGRQELIRGEPSGPDYEPLDRSYRRRDKPHRFFCKGKVFQMLWSEPAGSSAPTDATGLSLNHYGETVHSKIRRFVVVVERGEYCLAVSVRTYGGRGLARPGLDKSEHAIIHTGMTPPPLQRDEYPTRGQQPCKPRAIRVIPFEDGERLHPMSRVNLGKIFTIEHNVKVKAFGHVHDPSLPEALLGQFQDVLGL